MKFPFATSTAMLALSAIATPALAQAQDRATHFDGPYISGFVGGALQANDSGDGLVFDTDGDGSFGDPVLTSGAVDAFGPGFCNGTANSNLAADDCRRDKDGLEYGARIGFDKRLGGGNFVLGALVEASKNKARDGSAGFSVTPASYSIQRELDHAVSLRARAGFTPGGGALFYATGGASYARIDHKFTVLNNSLNSFDETRDKKRVWGWQAGGGAEVMLTNNISLGLEYLYNQYKDDKYSVAVGPGTALPTNPFLLVSGGTDLRQSDDKFAYHSVRAAISFQF